MVSRFAIQDNRNFINMLLKGKCPATAYYSVKTSDILHTPIYHSCWITPMLLREFATIFLKAETVKLY